MSITNHFGAWLQGTRRLPGSVWGALALGGLALLLWIDTLTPKGVAVGSLYAVCVLLAGFVRNRLLLHGVAGLAALLVVVGGILSPDVADAAVMRGHWLINRAAGLVWVLFALGFARIALAAEQLAAESAAAAIEAAERHGLRRFRLLADAMPLTVWSATPDGQLDFLSRQISDYCGRGEDEILREGWDAIIHPDELERARDAWRASLAAQHPHELEVRLRRHDGEYRWHQLRALPVRDESGAIYAWFGSISDIEAQKRLELEARHLATRLANVMASITDSVLVVDRNWRYTYVNPHALALSGRGESELLGHVMFEVFPEMIGTEYERRYRIAMETGNVQRFQGWYERDKVWLDTNVYPSPEGLTFFIRDVTHEHTIEAQFQAAQRMESLGRLTGGIAHDFNNLLTVILGNADLLADEIDDAERRAAADMIAGAAQRAAELTQRLLAFSRRQALAPERIDVDTLVGGMHALLCRALGEHVEIAFVNHAGLWPALIDPTQLESAILNLCINARDAMPSGGRLTIETGNAHLDADYCARHTEIEPGDYVMIAVSDTGTGIAPEHLARVFEPFFTTKDKDKGTGLGLAMVFGFMKQSRGHVNVYSEPGHGTTVKLYLPRAGEAAAAPVVGAAIAEVRGGTETVLLVEDDELVRAYARVQLAGLGYRVFEAPDGPHALQLLREHPEVALLFTDVVMPGGMSGRDLADAALRLQPALRVLYTSGYTENAIVHHGRLDPGVRLLGKPYRRAELARQLRAALDEQ